MSRSEAFTAGPWGVVGDEGEAIGAPFTKGDANVICMTPEWGMEASRAQWPANARLIAASPDMYAAHDRIANGDWLGEMRFAEDSDADFLLRVIAKMRETAREALSKAGAS